LRVIRRSASTFSAQEKAFKNLVSNAHTVVIDLGDGKSFTAILKRHSGSPVTDDILHIDFFQIFDKEITIEVPVKIIGDSKVMAGGDLRLNNRKLKVKALPQNLLILLRLILRHNMVTNYMLLKFYTNFKSCTQTTMFVK
jgi:hypothetical protein